MIQEKYLIIYYSFTGNLESLIPMFKNQLDIDSVRLELVENYPKAGKDFLKRYRDEESNNILPRYKETKIDLNKYETIFIATPNWGNKVPPVIKSFLSNNLLTNKTIIPIISHGGNGEVGIIEEMISYLSGNKIKESLVFRQANLTEKELCSFLNKVLQREVLI